MRQPLTVTMSDAVRLPRRPPESATDGDRFAFYKRSSLRLDVLWHLDNLTHSPEEYQALCSLLLLATASELKSRKPQATLRREYFKAIDAREIRLYQERKAKLRAEGMIPESLDYLDTKTRKPAAA